MGESLSDCCCGDFQGLQVQPWLQSAPSSIVGLRNRDNRCYANAALQCLTRIAPIEHFFHSGFIHTCNDPISGYFCAFLYSQQANSPDESRVTALIHSLRFSIGKLHDSYEFLQSLLCSLQASPCEPNLSSLFQGSLITTRFCDFCDSAQKSGQSCMGISLELPASKAEVRLVDLIAEFFTPEVDWQSANCAVCGQLLPSTHSLTMQPPTVLLLHLKRMLLTAAGDMRKSHTFVHCPASSLDLSAYSDSQAEYDLAAVISHENNHYTCQVHRPDFGLWLHCDDERVRELSSCHLSSSAYVLMYTLHLAT